MDRIKVGIITLMVGTTVADSDNLIIPLTVVLLGALLIWRGSHAR